MTPSRLSPIDLALVAVYLIAITIFGLGFSKKSSEKSLKNYFLADNVIPWWAIALSIVSAETSTLTIVSIPGVAYAGEFGFLQVVIGYMLGRIVVALLFLPRYFRGEMLTAYQLIDRRFGHTLHKVTAGLFLLTRAAAEGVRVFAISIVVGIAIGTGDILSIGIISALTLLYTFEGGLAAVIWTDVVQMGLYVAGTVVALFTLGAHVPGGWAHIHAVAAPLGKFHMLDFALNLTTTYTFWAGAVGGCFLTMASHGTDQLMVQRMLAARSLRDSQLALLASGAVIFIQFTLFLLIGVGLFVFYGAHPQAFTSNDRIFPTFIVHELPHGVAGLLVAAILAAAMSNLSAALNSLASTTVVDFYMPSRVWLRSRVPYSSQSHRGEWVGSPIVSRAATVFWALVLFGMAVYSIQVGGKGHVVETGLSIASVAYGCLLGVFLLGTLTRYATQTGALLGMICGFAVNLVLWLPTITSVRQIGTMPIPHVAFTWYVPIGSAVTFAVGSLGSLVFRKQSTAKAVAVALCLGLGLGSMRAQTVSPGLKDTVALQAMLTSQNREVGHPVSETAYDFTPISTLVNTAIKERKLPGAVVVVGHNGKIVFEQAYGNRALEPAVEPMTTDTIFDMASLTKVLATTVAVLQLYEQHKLNLDDPVAKYLPEFAQNGKGKITIRELLTHYSGLPEDIDMKDAWGLDKPDKAEGLRRAMASVPYGPRGVTFKYSDINFITLGLLVETLSGQTLDAYAMERIFMPLLLDNTRFLPAEQACAPEDETPVIGDKVCNKSGYVWDWNTSDFLPNTAPTAHDDQGTATTNPNFDHLLRGTVHDPSTRRMGGVAGHAGVFSTAEDAAKFAQALLDKLLYDKGSFPLLQKSLQLATSPNEPATAVKTATIFTPDGKTTPGVASRGLGWDLNTAYSRPRGEVFPIATAGHPGSFGHTGFTGTSLWIDPTTDTYVILLSNAVHIHGAASISALRGQVATAAAKALTLSALSAASSQRFVQQRALKAELCGWAIDHTVTGIEVLECSGFAALHEGAQRHGGHLRIGLLTNQTGLDSAGKRTVDILANAGPDIQLTTLFTPEHGLFGKQDTEHPKSEEDSATHLPVLSLYGPKDSDKRPKRADLAKLDAVVIDLQDAGERFYTYETIVGYFVEAVACTDTEIVILDRPTLASATAARGPISDPGRESYVNYMIEPVESGMTLGELARLFNRSPFACEYKNADGSTTIHSASLPALPAAHLTVVPLQNWTRTEFYDDTHLPWVNPSPNLRSLNAAILYPGIALAETTNISVGRGTATPFENVGAPYIRAKELADYLTGREIPGVKLTATTMAIAEDANKYPSHGQTIPGIHFETTDRNVLDAPELGIELLSALHKLYPQQFQLAKCMTNLANAATLAAIERGDDPRAIAASWQADLDRFNARREKYLLYR